MADATPADSDGGISVPVRLASSEADPAGPGEAELSSLPIAGKATPVALAGAAGENVQVEAPEPATAAAAARSGRAGADSAPDALPNPEPDTAQAPPTAGLAAAGGERAAPLVSAAATAAVQERAAVSVDKAEAADATIAGPGAPSAAEQAGAEPAAKAAGEPEAAAALEPRHRGSAKRRAALAATGAAAAAAAASAGDGKAGAAGTPDESLGSVPAKRRRLLRKVMDTASAGRRTGGGAKADPRPANPDGEALADEPGDAAGSRDRRVGADARPDPSPADIKSTTETDERGDAAGALEALAPRATPKAPPTRGSRGAENEQGLPKQADRAKGPPQTARRPVAAAAKAGGPAGAAGAGAGGVGGLPRAATPEMATTRTLNASLGEALEEFGKANTEAALRAEQVGPSFW